MRLSKAAARALMLAAQGLDAPTRAAATKEDVLAAIRRMALLQIDTISVVARSPYLVLWSRLGAYEPSWLDELHAEGRLFEYWAHAACFLPIEDYPIYRTVMLEHARDGGHPAGHNELLRTAVDGVLARIRANGPVRSASFERTEGKGGGWWSWKPEKHALEHLFNVGELMIARREGFQRVYDLRERVLPSWDDARALDSKASRRELALRAVGALGVATRPWVRWYFWHLFRRGRSAADALDALLRTDEIRPVEIDGIRELAYVRTVDLPLIERATAGGLDAASTTLLSPFDPLVSDRARALALFGFDYRIETYVPAGRRKFGYYSLPILHRGTLVGRLDAKAHRKQGVFEVKSLHLESAVVVSHDLADALAAVLRSAATWHGTPDVQVRTAPDDLARLLRRALDGAT